MINQQPKEHDEDKRLGRFLDYAQLKSGLFEEDEEVRYQIGSPFVVDRIDRSRPLDKVLYKGQWFCAGYIVSRQTADNQTVFSQIIRIYPAQNQLYHAALMDLRRRDSSSNACTTKEFRPNEYEPEMPRELLVPLCQLKFIAYTPTNTNFYQPKQIIDDQLETKRLESLKMVVDEQKAFKKAISNSSNEN